MVGILNDHQPGRDIRLHQPVVHQLRLFDRNHIVPVAVDQQEGRIIRCHVVDRAGLQHIMLPEPDQLHGLNIGVWEGPGQVGDRRHGNDRLHAAGLLRILTYIPARGQVGGPKQRDKVSARAGPDGPDPLGIQVELGGIRPQEADRTFNILDHGRECPCRVQTIVYGNDEKALSRHLVGKHQRFRLITMHPAPAVNIDNRRPRSTGGREVEIQYLGGSCGGAVRQVG